MRSNFATALTHVLRDEGGYVDHPSDPGGATNMGITRATLAQWRGRPVTKAEVKTLSRTEAGAIYRARFWSAVKGDDLPAGLDYCVFDAAVHSGPGRAARWLQAELGVQPDGTVGPITLRVAKVKNGAPLIRAVCRRRLRFMQGLRTWATFGRGWTRRMKAVEASALALLKSHETTEERDMTDTKRWYESKTVWGALVTLLALVAGSFGLAIGEAEQTALIELAPQLVAMAGAIVALVGRLTAKAAIA